MALLSFSSILLALIVSGVAVVNKVSIIMEEEIGNRALSIGRTLAQMEVIQRNVGKPGGWGEIQPIAEKTRLATGVEYIVVVDMKGYRYSHPLADRIGKPFSGEDLAPALRDKEYITKTSGVMGPAVRALVPVKTDEGHRQVGVVVVGVLTPTIKTILQAIKIEMYSSLGIGLIVGLLGSLFLANKIKKAMLGMEPQEIARILEERTSILQALGEGIIAIDGNNSIIVANEAARRILGVGDDIIGKPITEILPESYLTRVLQTGVPELNQERVINNTVIISNRIPIRVKDRVVGAVATFRDRTEVHRLAEELTGVKAFVEALRVQNHEHMNRLHTIAGLIQLKKYQQVMDFVFEVTEEDRQVTGLITKRIADYNIAGLLLGKYGRAKELQVELKIDRKICLSRIPLRLDSNAMVVIIGNLLENALEAVRNMPDNRRIIEFSLREQGQKMIISVEDSGPGIPEKNHEQIFQQGYSTKGDQSRGIGLYLVKRHVETGGGMITVASEEGKGTAITVEIPF